MNGTDDGEDALRTHFPPLGDRSPEGPLVFSWFFSRTTTPAVFVDAPEPFAVLCGVRFPFPPGSDNPNSVKRLAPAILVLLVAGPVRGGWTAAHAFQEPPSSAVLAPGQSHYVPVSDLTLTFEAVLEDSRCPAGVSCIWAGDAQVRLRVASKDTQPASYTLHTNDRFEREVLHGETRVRLVALTPEPTRDGPPKPDQYRATLEIQRKQR